MLSAQDVYQTSMNVEFMMSGMHGVVNCGGEGGDGGEFQVEGECGG